MSKMSELDADRQQIERLTDAVRPPSFAESKCAGAYREVYRADINQFLVSAVRLAIAKPQYINGSVRVLESHVTDAGNVSLVLDNGDIVFIDIEHLVPRPDWMKP